MTRRHLFRQGCVALAGAVLSACNLFEPDLKVYDDLDHEIGLEVQGNGIPSLAAGVVKGGGLVWQRHYGHADVRNQTVADRRTVYGLASVSKLVVVTAVMQLSEQGLLDLDDDVNDHVVFQVRNPRFPEDRITLAHLLTHRSSLAWPVEDDIVPGYYQRFEEDSSPPLGAWLRELVQPGGSRYRPGVWKETRPGEVELYSNIGVSLLGHVVEAVSGLDFNEYCRRNIFVPLDMPNTSFRYDDLDEEWLATPYVGSQPLRHYRYGGYPAGDLKSTVEDFSHFVAAYVNRGEYRGRRILAERSVDRILELRNPVSGLCLLWNRTVGGWYGHAGGKPGVSAYAEFHPEHRVGVIIVSNRRQQGVYPGDRIHSLVRRIARAHWD